MDYKIQSIILDRDVFTLDAAIKWIRSHNYRLFKVDKTPNSYRFRQEDPNKLKQEHYNKYVTKKITKGIKYIIAYKE
jgi:hypothetical protein